MNARPCMQFRVDPDAESRVRVLVSRGCALLDEERFTEWLALCAPSMRYRIEAHSPEIRRDMTWLDLDHAGLAQLFSNLRMHERDTGALFRHPSLIEISGDSAGGCIQAITSVLVLRISPLGEPQLFCAARYHDSIELDGDAARLAARTVRLASRVFPSDSGGSHVPI